MAKLTARNVHLTDQVLAALAESGTFPLSTAEVAAKAGLDPEKPMQVQDAWRVLDRLARRNEVERIRLEGIRQTYWRPS